MQPSDRLERLKKTQERLMQEWKLIDDKVGRLRLDLAVEAGSAIKFQLEQQIKAAEIKLNDLSQKIQETEIEIEKNKKDWLQPRLLEGNSDTSIKSTQNPVEVINIAQNVIELEQPEGQVPLSSPFYVERPPIETDCYAAIVKTGALIRVKASRQMGKTSLMTRILDHGEQNGYRTVPLYFQEADGEIFGSLDLLLKWLCVTVAEELSLPTGKIDDLWINPTLGNKRKCTNYFQQEILSGTSSPLVLGLDEVDLIFEYLKIAQDFFALLRTWHERGKNQLIWQKLRLVIVHSREVYIPLKMHQSPFNVGIPVELSELTQEQVQDLVDRHGLAWQSHQTEHLMTMVGGHPHLVRVALYEIARERTTLNSFLKIAPTEEGIYSDHLRRHLENLKKNQDLAAAMKQIIAANAAVQIDSSLSFQLRSMGLVKFIGNKVVPLCDLYRCYFRSRL